MIANNGGATNSLYGNVALGGASSSTVTFIDSGTGILGFEGVISGAGINIVKTTGVQTIVFNGANTYTGTTTINHGPLMDRRAAAERRMAAIFLTRVLRILKVSNARSRAIGSSIRL